MAEQADRLRLESLHDDALASVFDFLSLSDLTRFVPRLRA